MQKLVPPCGTLTGCILTLRLAKKASQNDQNGSIEGMHPHVKRNIFLRISIETISKPQMVFDGKARADEKAQHTREYVSILKRCST
jgi:hypothetical protein